jgi:hypothetical protein
MAHRGLTRGTPLHTLALLLANRQDLICEASLAASGAQGSLLSPGAAAGPGPTPPGYNHSANPSYNPGGSAVGAPMWAPGSAGGMMKPGGGAGAAAAGGGVMSAGGSNAAAMASAGGLFSPSGSSGAVGFFSPSAGPQGDALLMHWRENLAVMVANRTAGGVEAMMRLGDLLLSQQKQVRGWVGGSCWVGVSF